VLSPTNTSAEMRRKRREYFEAGVQVVWMVDPRTRRVDVFTTPENSLEFSEKDTLDAGDVLPGFKLVLRDVFSELDRVARAQK
jgi:Uma2 family endonuclease